MKKVIFFLALFTILFISCKPEEAVYYQLSYESEYDSDNIPDSLSLKEGTILTEKHLPQLNKQGFVFSGWYDAKEKAIPNIYSVYKDTTLTAKWIENSQVQYKVVYWIQNLDDLNYTKNDVITLKGTLNKETKAEAKNYSGFTVQPFSQEVINADGSTVVNIYYKRNTNTKYTVQHYLQNDDLESYSLQEDDSQVLSGITGASTLAVAKTYSNYEPLTIKQKPIAGDESTVIKVYYNLLQNVKYQVKHYLQNIDDDEYTLDAKNNQTLSGAVNKNTKAVANTYTGFTVQPFEQKLIANDESTVVEIYYNRNLYTLTVDSNDGNEPTTFTQKYGSKIPTIPKPTKTGSSFSRWNIDLPEVFREDITIKAIWTAAVNCFYKVEYYYENIDNTEYTINENDTEFLIGIEGNTTNIEAKAKTGITPVSPIEQQVIKSDGSTTVKVYYKRTKYTFTFNTNGGSSIESKTGKFGAATPAIPVPTKDGYIFKGWTPAIPQTFSENKTFTASWAKASVINGSGITINLPDTSSAPTITVEYNNDRTYTFYVADEYYGYTWYIDGVKIEGILNSKTISEADLIGLHEIMVIVLDSELKPYSAKYIFKREN